MFFIFLNFWESLQAFLHFNRIISLFSPRDNVCSLIGWCILTRHTQIFLVWKLQFKQGAFITFSHRPDFSFLKISFRNHKQCFWDFIWRWLVGLLCDLLWSDPDKDIAGWGENDRGVSWTFGPDVVTKFLNKHDLDLICRAHQVVICVPSPVASQAVLACRVG